MPLPNLAGIDWPTAILIALAVSAALFAVVSLVLVLGGVYAFINFRAIAKAQAEETAKTTAEKIAEATANKYIQDNFAAIIRAYAEVSSFGQGAPDQQADEIAHEESHIP